MAPKSLGLWMLFLWIQEGDGENMGCRNDTGILGKAVELKCCYPKKDLKPDLFRVHWQLKGNVDCVVAAYLPGQTPAPQCERYKNRTELKKDYLHLELLNVSLEDSNIYECILQKKEKGKYQKIFHGLIGLEVAANDFESSTYSESLTADPIIHDSRQQTQVIALSSIAAVFVIILVIWFLYKLNHSHHRAYNAPVGVDQVP